MGPPDNLHEGYPSRVPNAVVKVVQVVEDATSMTEDAGGTRLLTIMCGGGGTVNFLFLLLACQTRRRRRSGYVRFAVVVSTGPVTFIVVVVVDVCAKLFLVLGSKRLLGTGIQTLVLLEGGVHLRVSVCRAELAPAF